MTTTPRPASGPARSNPPRGRVRRAIGLAAALALSLLLHVWLLAWLGSRPEFGGEAGAIRSDPVVVALLSGEAQMKPTDAAPAPAAVRPRPPRPARPAPRPNAITTAPASEAPKAERPPEPEPEAQAGAEGLPTADVPSPAPDPAPGTPATPPEASPSPSVAQPSAPPAGDPAASGSPAGTGSPAATSTPAGAPAAAEGPAKPALVFGTALAAPPTGRWQFRVYYGDYSDNRPVATLDYLIEHDGDRYRLRTEGRAEGLTALLYSGVLTQASGGRLTENGLQPERFAEQRGKRAERWATVDWPRGEIAFSGGERAKTVPGLQDRLSVLVQLGLLARAAPERFAAGQSVVFDEMTLRDVERARYASRGDEVLETDTGTLRTLHLERTEPRKRDDPVVEIWLGYDLGLIPVRIRMTDVGGRILDQLLVR